MEWVEYLRSLQTREKVYDEDGMQYADECNDCGILVNNPDDINLNLCAECTELQDKCDHKNKKQFMLFPG